MKSLSRPSLMSFPIILLTAMVLLPSFVNAETYRDKIERRKMYLEEMTNREADIKELLTQKRLAKNADELKFLLQDLTVTYEELEEIYENYEKNERQIRFRYPEKDDESERKYTLYKLKSLQDFESDVGIDGQLDRIKRKMMQVYRPRLSSMIAAEEKDKQKRKPASDDGRIRLRK